MAAAEGPQTIPEVPEAVAAPRSRHRVQLVWIVPIVAALIGGWLAVKSILDRGPTITLRFETAEGLEAGKTKIKFKDVDVGLVKSVALSSDTKYVIATADMVKSATGFLVEDTRFWIVRPRISGGAVSGLGTLLSGSYVGMDAGGSQKSKRDFTALRIAPVITSDVPGREFILHSQSIGSLEVGAPVFFRRLQVGQVSAYELDRDGKAITFKVFVNAPYDRFVSANTRFWHSSGVHASLSASGVDIETESIVAILLGGLSFETPETATPMPVAEPNSEFTLFDNRVAAMKNPDPDKTRMLLVFRESVRGLAPGATVDFRGIAIGEVASIKIDFDEKSKQLNVPVEIDVYPGRLASRRFRQQDKSTEEQTRARLAGMVERGLRAQLRSGNLITGQLYVAIDFFPTARPATLRTVDGGVVELPVVPSATTELQTSLASITSKIQDIDLKQITTDVRETLAKIQALQFDRVGDDVHRTLANADRIMTKLDGMMGDEARAVLVEAHKALASADRMLREDSSLSQDAREVMRELSRTAYTFRMLADYLERHPESLIMGKKQNTQ